MLCDVAGLIIEPYTSANSDVKIRTMAQTYDQVLPPGVKQTQCCPFSSTPYDFSPTAETQCVTNQPCEVACDFRPIPATLSPAASVPVKIYAAVDGRCQQVAARATGETFPGDPYCGGKYGTCIGCQATPPPPDDPVWRTPKSTVAIEVLLLLAVCLGAVVGGVLLGMRTRERA